MLDLVKIENGIPITTTLAIAKGTGIEHASVILLVRKYIQDLEKFGLVRFEIEPRSEGQHGGGDREIALLNERQATLIISYMKNTEIVREFKIRLVTKFYEMAEESRGTTHTLLLPDQIALTKLKVHVEAFEFLGAPKHYAQIEAVKYVKTTTGVDYSPALIYSPAQSNIKETEVMLEPTELGKRHGISGRAINKLLEDKGYQIKLHTGWEPTKAGTSYATKHSWIRGHKTGYNLKWRATLVDALISTTKVIH